jgi:hypothetical protein
MYIGLPLRVINCSAPVKAQAERRLWYTSFIVCMRPGLGAPAGRRIGEAALWMRTFLSGKVYAIGTYFILGFQKYKHQFCLWVVGAYHSDNILIADLFYLCLGHIVHWVASVWGWLDCGINDNCSQALGGEPLVCSWLEHVQVLGNPG